MLAIPDTGRRTDLGGVAQDGKIVSNFSHIRTGLEIPFLDDPNWHRFLLSFKQLFVSYSFIAIYYSRG